MGWGVVSRPIQIIQKIRIDRSARLGVLVGCGRAILKKFSHNATPSICIKVEEEEEEGNDED